MLACLADVLLSILEDSDGIVECFLVEQRWVIVGHRVFSFIEVKRETEHDIEGAFVKVMTAAVSITRLFILAVIRVEGRADGLNALWC